MAPSAKQFAKLLQAGITAIAKRTSKPKGVIRDELGYAIGRDGGSAIEYWVYGDGRIPSRQEEIEALARVLVEAGGLDRNWLAAFLEGAGYANRGQLLADLFPDAADQRSHNLPLPPTPFVGRTRELAALDALITNPDCRLITLVGPGGSGKTRLAVEAARAAHPTFVDGVAFIALAPLTAAEFVVATVATTLNFTLSGHATPQTQLLHYLRQKRLLLVLDNFEHLLSPPAPLPTTTEANPALALVNGILQEAPAVTLLVTSRERLNLQGEWVYDVGGLEILDADNPASTIESSALALFLQTAQRVHATFMPTTADQTAILRICQQVAGMPLALELAAAWVRVLSCGEIAEEIEASLGFLSATQRNLDLRHRSMHAVFDHSWNLLTTEEQEVFMRCSVFRGGFTREAAAQVAGATLLLLTTLVDKSLLSRQHEERFVIHELLRQFITEKLVEDSSEEIAVRNRHSLFYLEFLSNCEAKLNSAECLTTMKNIRQEIDNIKFSWTWAIAQKRLDRIDRSINSLYLYYRIGHYLVEANELFADSITRLQEPTNGAEDPKMGIIIKRIMARNGAICCLLGEFNTANSYLQPLINLEQVEEKALVLRCLGTLAANQAASTIAFTYYRESLALCRELGDDSGVIENLCKLANLKVIAGEPRVGKELAQESLTISYRIGRPDLIALSLRMLGWCLNYLGDYDAAENYLLEYLAIAERSGDKLDVGVALHYLALNAYSIGGKRLEDAVKFYEQAMDIHQSIGSRGYLCMTLSCLALPLIELSEYDSAQRYALEAKTIAEDLNDLDILGLCYYDLGLIACKVNNWKMSHNYLTQVATIGWQLQLAHHKTLALFLHANLLLTEEGLGNVEAELRLQKNAQAAEILRLVAEHPGALRAIKDRAQTLLAQTEPSLSTEVSVVSRTREQPLTLEEAIENILVI
ncbi:MAG: tetratricopeptide repeat protein [Caldilineaceae bacterium]